MKIGINCRFLHAAYLTGVERYAHNLLESLVEVGGGEEFVLFGCSGKEPSVPSGPNIHRAGSCAWKSAVARQLWEQIALPGLARKAKVDILINPVNTAPVRFSRNLTVIHDLAFLDHPEWFSKNFVRLYRAVVPKAARHALAIMTVSEFSKNRIVELLGISPEKVHVVYQGIDPSFQPASKEEIQRVRAEYGLNAAYILFTGSITPRKNLSAAVAAFDLVRKRLPLHEMVIAGVSSFQFPKTDVFSKYMEGIKAIGYVGNQNLPAMYSGADVLVYPSLYEGFGLPPLEAMACGTPVVTSNCTSLPEAVGDAALKVAPTDVEEIAEAIYSIISNPEFADGLRRCGLDRARLFSWPETARQTLNICAATINTSDNH